jgi:hypothetical protein
MNSWKLFLLTISACWLIASGALAYQEQPVWAWKSMAVSGFLFFLLACTIGNYPLKPFIPLKGKLLKYFNLLHGNKLLYGTACTLALAGMGYVLIVYVLIPYWKPIFFVAVVSFLGLIINNLKPDEA